MRLLAQVAQVGHTQPISTWQSNPEDTPRAQHHRLNPAQVSLIMGLQLRWTPYGYPDHVGLLMVIQSRCTSLWDSSPGGTHYADDEQGLPEVRGSDVGDATNPSPVPGCLPIEALGSQLCLSCSVHQSPGQPSTSTKSIRNNLISFIYP